jgi:hypothetical protein
MVWTKQSSTASTSGSSIKLTDFKLPRYKEIAEPVGYIGRWFDKTIDGTSCKVTINEGSEFYFKVKNTTTVSVNFKVITAQETPYFAYSIDGGAMTRQLITNPTLPTLSTDEHVIRIVCDGLTEHENKWNGEIGFAFVNITVGTGGIVTGILPKNRIGLFYGDSITEGVRVLSGTEANSNGNSGSGAFPFPTCENLNAISYRVGFGGTGVTQGGGGGVPKCLTVIDNMTSTRSAPYLEPDFIVINHGTNDNGASSETFKTEYNAILNRLSIKYPGVPIFAMIPFIQYHAQDIRDCVADKLFCYLVETDDWGVTFTDWVHPDINGGIIAGEKLADAITKVLGKEFFI